MKYLLVSLMFFLFGCVTTPEPMPKFKPATGSELCASFCHGGGQGYVEPLYMGAGTCLCKNKYGIESAYYLCIGWNPNQVTECEEQKKLSLDALGLEHDYE